MSMAVKIGGRRAFGGSKDDKPKRNLYVAVGKNLNGDVVETKKCKSLEKAKREFIKTSGESENSILFFEMFNSAEDYSIIYTKGRGGALIKISKNESLNILNSSRELK